MRWFAAWTVVGVLYVLVIVAAFTIFAVVALPLAVLGTAWLVRARRPGAAGVLSGLGLPLLLVAFINRTGSSLSPWPWLAAGLVLVAAGLVVQLWIRSRRSGSGPPRFLPQ